MKTTVRDLKELLELYAEPKPHFNTLSTMVRTLEANGYVSHKAYGNSYQYYPIVTREEYAGSSFKGIISSYFNNSYLSAVSALVKEEKIPAMMAGKKALLSVEAVERYLEEQLGGERLS